jgi:hypothetical protein
MLKCGQWVEALKALICCVVLLHRADITACGSAVTAFLMEVVVDGKHHAAGSSILLIIILDVQIRMSQGPGAAPSP